MGRLPLKYVWFDGKELKDRPTDPTLAGGHRLDGHDAYSMIMSYFTTNNMKPNEVHDLGKRQVAELYPKVRASAKVFCV